MNYLCVVSECFVDQQGGAPRVAWDFCRLMQEHGHNVSMLSRRVGPNATAVDCYDGIRVVRFDLPDTKDLDPFKLHRKIAAGSGPVREHLLDTSWDVVHMHLPIDGKRALKLIGPGPAYIYTAHSPTVLEVAFNWSRQGLKGGIKKILGGGAIRKLEREVLTRAERIQTLSHFTRDALSSCYDVAGKTSVTPHWCRSDFVRRHSRKEARCRLGWQESDRILFSVRHFGWRHGLDLAVRATAPVLKRNPDVRLVLAGDGPLRAGVEQLTDSLGVRGQIDFPGSVSDETLKLCYEGADLFILPTRALECFGLIVLEAYAFGLPILSTDAGALPELIRPIAPDMIVAAGDVAGMTSKLEAWLGGTLKPPSPEILQAYVADRFSYEAVVPRILRFITGS